MNFQRPFDESNLPFPGGQMLSGEGDGQLIEPIPGHEVCDFCGDPNPYKVFGAESTTIQSVPVMAADGPTIEEHRSGDGWLACRECAERIDEGDEDGLVDRSVSRFLDAHAHAMPDLRRVPRPLLRQEFLRVQSAFWSSRAPAKDRLCAP